MTILLTWYFVLLCSFRKKRVRLIPMSIMRNFTAIMNIQLQMGHKPVLLTVIQNLIATAVHIQNLIATLVQQRAKSRSVICMERMITATHMMHTTHILMEMVTATITSTATKSLPLVSVWMEIWISKWSVLPSCMKILLKKLFFLKTIFSNTW